MCSGAVFGDGAVRADPMQNALYMAEDEQRRNAVIACNLLPWGRFSSWLPMPTMEEAVSEPRPVAHTPCSLGVVPRRSAVTATRGVLTCNDLNLALLSFCRFYWRPFQLPKSWSSVG